MIQKLNQYHNDTGFFQFESIVLNCILEGEKMSLDDIVKIALAVFLILTPIIAGVIGIAESVSEKNRRIKYLYGDLYRLQQDYSKLLKKYQNVCKMINHKHLKELTVL